MRHDELDGLIVVVNHLLGFVLGCHFLSEHLLRHLPCCGRAFHLAGKDGLLHQRANQVLLLVVGIQGEIGFPIP